MLVIAAQRNIRERSNLLRRKRIAHSGNRYVSETCGKHFTRKFKLTSHKYVTKKGQMEQKELKKETEPLQNKEDKYTESIQSKAVVEREIDSGLELTKRRHFKNNLKIRKTRPQLTIEFE